MLFPLDNIDFTHSVDIAEKLRHQFQVILRTSSAENLGGGGDFPADGLQLLRHRSLEVLPAVASQKLSLQGLTDHMEEALTFRSRETQNT